MIKGREVPIFQNKMLRRRQILLNILQLIHEQIDHTHADAQAADRDQQKKHVKPVGKMHGLRSDIKQRRVRVPDDHLVPQN